MLNTKDYSNKQTSIFNEYGVFFAFSDSQFNENKKEGIDYASLGAGMIAPKESAADVIDALSNLAETHAAAELKEYGAKRIIHYELANHEAQITYDIKDTVAAVSVYGITAKQVAAEFGGYMDKCAESDNF